MSPGPPAGDEAGPRPGGTLSSAPRREADVGRPPPWRLAVRDVGVVAVLVVTAVLGAVILTGVLPPEGQRLVFHTPLAIVVLLLVTAWVLWRSARRRPPTG